MQAITISRLYGSGGEEIAHKICDTLAFQLLDKHLLAQAAADAGLLGEGHADHFDEHVEAKSFQRRLAELLFGLRAGSAVERPKLTWGGLEADMEADWMVKLVEKTIISSYEEGGVVIMGRGGQAVLKDKPDVLHVRIVAPVEARLAYVQAQFGLDARSARQRIDQYDTGSERYLRRYYNVQWDDPALYHLVINAALWEAGVAAQIIIDAARQLQKTEVEP